MESDCDVFHKQWCSTDFGGPGSPVPGADSDNATSAAAAAAALCEQAYPGCAWISANQTFDGDLEWQHMSKRPVERLWLFRYWFALVALRQGVNTLISDLDVVISGGAPQQQQDPPTQLQFEPPYSCARPGAAPTVWARGLTPASPVSSYNAPSLQTSTSP